jgi:hypothetical protein
MALNIASSGGAFVLAGKVINSNMTMDEMRTFAMVGAAVEVASSYIATNFLESEGKGTL